MNKLVLFILLLSLSTTVFAQWMDHFVPQEENVLDAGLGMTWIDSQGYYLISLNPDICIGKVGIGLGINLLYNTNTGKLRNEDWDSFYDYARIIRYVRYGRKGDRFYSRVGALDLTRLGHGFIMNYYTNQLDYDERKIGLVFDVDFGKFGFESLTSNLGRLEILAGRGYFRPLYTSKIPGVKNLGFGASIVTDIDPDVHRSTEDGVTVWGIDVELPIIKSRLLSLMLYADHAKIVDYGSGQTVGIGVEHDLMPGVLDVGLNLERRFLGNSFIANYFDPFYEVLRYSMMGELMNFYEYLGGDPAGIPAVYQTVDVDDPISKQLLLPMMTGKRRSWYTALYANVLSLVRVMGFYERVDGRDESGRMHLYAGLSQSVPLIAFEASYDKYGMDSFGDIFTLDYRSMARVGVGYKMLPFLLLYFDYIWSFQWDEDLGQYKPQERFQPRIAFRYRF